MRKIHRWLYILSLCTWLAHLVLIVANIFVDLVAISFIFLFISLIIQGVCSGAFSSNDFTSTKVLKKRWLDYVLMFSKIISILSMGVGVISLFVSGGGPEIIDDKFCVVNHGEIIRIISEEWYVYLSICDFFVSFFGLLIFTTLMFERIRYLYLSQRSTQ